MADRLSWLVTVGVIALLITSTLASAALTSELTVSDPEPGVDTVYNDTFRVLASNDADPARGTSTVRGFEYTNGTIETVNRTVVTQPVQLWEDSIRPTDALAIANESDMYQSGLTGPTNVPYQDQWTTLAEWNGTWGEQGLRIIPIYGADPERATDMDGEYTVEVRNPNGWWDPVYNAEVERNGTRLTVTNPETAMVHTAKYESVTNRKIEIVRSLLRYSELAENNASARETAVVPMDNGTEVFPTVEGASVPLVWESGSHALVKDAYVGFIDVVPGVWYRSRYVTQAEQVNTHVPWDYRIDVPPDYSEAGNCTIGTITHPLTRWADYRLVDSNASVANVTVGNISMDQWRDGQWTTLNFSSTQPRPLPLGNHTMTASLRIDVELERRYGVSSAQCDEWSETETINQSLVVNRSVPIEAVSNDNLSIDVHVFDRPGEDVVSVNWTGRQGLTAGAVGWESIEVQVGEKTMYVTAPWRFFSVSRNTAVEERTTDEVTTVNASHSFEGEYPAMLRYRASAANVSVTADQPAQQRIWWETTRLIENGSMPATTLPDTIVAPENTAPSPLYDQYAGVLKSTDRETGETVSVSAGDIWGRSISATHEVTRYEHSEMEVQIDDETGTAQIILRGANGTPISGRELSVEGAATSTVVTDSNGRATVNATNPIVKARFAGDTWWKPHPRYYIGTQALAISSTPVVVDALEVVGYLGTAISNVTLVIEWLALGIFALLWTRYMRDEPAGG